MSNILLGVGGGIAAYKVAALSSSLVQAGHSVRVAMTRGACEFVGPRTFEGLTSNPAILSSTQVDADGNAPHIVATTAADILVIAPATAGLLARLAAGWALIQRWRQQNPSIDEINEHAFVPEFGPVLVPTLVK